MAPAPISQEIFQQGLEAARDAGQITQHDYELGSEHMRQALNDRGRHADVVKVGGMVGAATAYMYSRNYRRPPYSWPVTGVLVVGTAIMTSFLPLVPKLYRETKFVQSLDNANDFQRAVMRSLKAASMQAVPGSDPDSAPGLPQRWQEAGTAGAAATAAQSSWDAIRNGQHPQEQQAKSATPVRDALAVRQRQQQQDQGPNATNAQEPSKDGQLEAERRDWEAMMAKERETAQGK